MGRGFAPPPRRERRCISVGKILVLQRTKGSPPELYHLPDEEAKRVSKQLEKKVVSFRFKDTQGNDHLLKTSDYEYIYFKE
jgi:hypothetical protein